LSFHDCTVEDIVDFYDHMRVPVSTIEREKMQGEYPYYGAQGIIDSVNKYIFDGEYVLVAEDGANLVTRNQPISQIAKGQFWVNNHAHVLKAKPSKTTDFFLNTLLNSISISGYITGAAQPKLSQKNLRIIKVAIPDFQEQLKIQNVLKTYSDLIENNRRRIKLLEESARLLYKEWFVQLRFPGHEHVKITDGVPEGWIKEPLGELLTLQRGFDLPSRNRKQGSIPIFASTGVNGLHNEAKVKGPGVVTGRSGSLGTVIYISKDFWPLNTTLWVKEFKKVTPIISTFILRALKLESYNGGAAVPTLNRNDVHKIDVLCPPDILIREFDLQVATVFEQIEKLHGYNKKLSEARDILLPRLMNGELTV